MNTPFPRAVSLLSCVGALLTASSCADDAADAAAPLAEARALLNGSANEEPIQGETRADFVWIGGAPVTHFSGSARRTASKVLAGDAPAAEDLNLQWQASWTEAELRLRVTVRDDVLVRDSAEPWEDDSFEVYLDPDASGGDAYDRRNDYQLVFRLDDPAVYVGVSSLQQTDGIDVRTVPSTGNLHVTELKIPWARLGITPVAGQQLGIDVHVNDDDDGGARDTKLGAFAERDEAWAQPRSFGLVRLGPAVQVPGSHQLRVRVENAVTGEPVEHASVQASGYGRSLFGPSKQTSREGIAMLGSCGYEGSPITTNYDFANYAIEVRAPGFEDYQGDAFAQPLLAWCTEVAKTISLIPKR